MKSDENNNKGSEPAELPNNLMRDGALSSPWEIASNIAAASGRPPVECDVLIIGGGITGITAGLLAQKAGKNCLIAEAHTIGFGTTGGTSAHINTFADTSYKEAEDAFGEDGAQLFADAINESIKIIRDNIDAYKIDCDFEIKNGYIFAEDENQAKQLDDIHLSTQKVGVDISYTNNVPTPVAYQKAVMLAGQAQFHPIKYINALAREFVKAGGAISENTKIDSLEKKGETHLAKTGDQAIIAGKVIYATHIPPGITSFSFRCAPYRSYVLGVKLKNNHYPDALIYDLQEPYHYFRTHVIDGQQLLIVGGNDHKTGHDDPEKAFAGLEKYTRKHYAVSSVKYRWSSQYYIPVDGFPYIGQIPEAAEGVYCATGFNGNGMMFGTISAKILSDLVTGKTNRYQEVFSPRRIKPVTGFTEFVKENSDVVYHFVADRLTLKETDSLKRILPGNGKVVEVDGRKIAAYRDDDGLFHTLNPICTHAGCIVNWNSEERSWDCPCHGARYGIDGKVLNGPATKNLPLIDWEAKNE